MRRVSRVPKTTVLLNSSVKTAADGCSLQATVQKVFCFKIIVFSAVRGGLHANVSKIEKHRFGGTTRETIFLVMSWSSDIKNGSQTQVFHVAMGATVSSFCGGRTSKILMKCKLYIKLPHNPFIVSWWSDIQHRDDMKFFNSPAGPCATILSFRARLI